ncbi:hypothetical protein K7432_011162 [Basidiobolus ranarum]|uniref:Uncharacterized protein n=1 Tax=Basidiobolus ranarum TaxID=34480 RepID=A0ABR2WMM3_9FUNG
MYTQLAIISTLLIATFTAGNQLQSTPYQVTGSNVASSSVSNTDSNLGRNPKGGQVVRKFKSSKEEDAARIQLNIENMIHRMSGDTYSKIRHTASNRQDVDQERGSTKVDEGTSPDVGNE